MKSLVTLLFLSLCAVSFAKFTDRSTKTKDKFYFLDKFCFDTSGIGTLNFTSSSDSGSLKLLTFLDDTWESVNQQDLTCEQLIATAERNFSLYTGLQHINFEFNDQKRPHFWYFAVANCEGSEFSLKYQMLFLQAKQNWNQQFSFDQEGSQLIYLLFTMFFFVAMVVNLYASAKLVIAKSFHPIMRILSISLLFQFLSVVFFAIHYLVYSSNGVGVPFLRVLATILDMFSSLSFMFLLILIAGGWGITYPTLSHFQERRIVLFSILGIFFLIYVILLFWGLFGVPRASSHYLYQTVPGVILLVVRVATTVYFLWCLLKTFRDESDSSKRTFYASFGIGYTIWFLTLPLIVLVALLAADWDRFKIVTPLYLLFTAVGYGVLSGLLWPSLASKYFQVAVPDLMSGGYERL